jgi:hypothetical protein
MKQKSNGCGGRTLVGPPDVEGVMIFVYEEDIDFSVDSRDPDQMILDHRDKFRPA